ncbi:hypothetical protein SAMD00024442_9_68 [Candidatus Symbiothrix dinenymphae]|nr:hypothetical protein SAMD00024442_9_68 [Candidatus Symbiothrix dinenymphae]
MEKIIIKIGASSDYYGAYAENCDGIYGAGPTPEAAKADALKGLELFVNSRDKSELPAILQSEYTIAFEYDMQSFLNHYNKIFSPIGLKRLTGFKQESLHHYSSGLKKPRLRQRKKIESALHQLGHELLEVKF